MKRCTLLLTLGAAVACMATAFLTLPANAADEPKASGPTSQVAGGFKTVDLRSIVNMDWKDEVATDGKGGWTDQGAANDMRNVKPGLTTLLGVPFDLIDAAKNGNKAVLTLKSRKFKYGPESATVAVGAKAAGIYFLHASAWTGGHVATYVVQYDDGTSVDIPIRAGEETTDWWGPVAGKSCRPAMHVTNNSTDDVGLLAFGWTNPNPDKTIKSLTFKTAGNDGIMVITAVTLSDKPAVLPDAKDIPLPEYLQSDVPTLDKSQWFPVEIKTDKFEPTCIDQAIKNGKAGEHGFLKNVKGKWFFEDGTPARLVGTLENPPGTHEECVYVARFMAKYGFSLCRIGHLIYGHQSGIIDFSKPDSHHLNAAAVDNLDFFIAELAKNGIYSRISTIWYRQVRKGDNIELFDEAMAWLHKRKGYKPDPNDKEDWLNTTGLTFFVPSVMEQNIGIIKDLMTHKNPYRDNKVWGEDPAIAQIEVTNEDGVFFFTFDGLPGPYKKMLDRQWCDWLLKKYGSAEGLAKAWGDDLGGTESATDGTIGRFSITAFEGAVPNRPHRLRDQLDFYVSLQDGYFRLAKETLRKAGIKQPICGSGWYGGGNTYYADIYANAKSMDYIDRHQYWSGGGDWQILELPFNTDCALKKPELMLKLGMERVINLPFSISEWAPVEPAQTRLEGPPLMGFYGYCLNGWDAPIHYGWYDLGFASKLHWLWPVTEPSTLCQYPAVAQMIRRGDIKEGPEAYIRNLSDDKVLSGQPLKDVLVRLDISGPFEAMSAAAGVNAKSLAATYATAVGKVGIAFTGKESKPDFSIDLNKYIDLDKKQIRSATDELFWDYGQGYVTANAPRMQAAVGFITNKAIKLKDCQIQTSNIIASVMVSPVDDKPLSESKDILITAVGRSRNPDMAYNRLGTRVLKRGETGPVNLEGVKGTVTLNRTGKCTVTALDAYGYKTVEVTPKVEGNQIVIPMDGQNKAPYYEVKFD